MMMGAATIPNLCELETEIDRRKLCERYAQALANIVDEGAQVFYSAIEMGGHEGEGFKFVIALTRLTDMQKVQAALKVLEEK